MFCVRRYTIPSVAPDRGRSEARQGGRRFQPGGATAPGSFEPKLVSKRQTRLAGLDDRILGLYAGGRRRRVRRGLGPSYPMKAEAGGLAEEHIVPFLALPGRPPQGGGKLNGDHVKPRIEAKLTCSR
jgi:hypothetical protein